MKNESNVSLDTFRTFAYISSYLQTKFLHKNEILQYLQNSGIAVLVQKILFANSYWSRQKFGKCPNWSGLGLF